MKKIIILLLLVSFVFSIKLIAVGETNSSISPQTLFSALPYLGAIKASEQTLIEYNDKLNNGYNLGEQEIEQVYYAFLIEYSIIRYIGLNSSTDYNGFIPYDEDLKNLDELFSSIYEARKSYINKSIERDQYIVLLKNCISYFINMTSGEDVLNDGSLKVRNNSIVGIQDNWLVGIRDNGKYSAYYHLADVDVPDGYKKKSENPSDLIQSFILTNGNIEILIASVASNVNDIVNTVYHAFSSFVADGGFISEIKDYKCDYGICKSFYYNLHYIDENNVNKYYISSLLYIPCYYNDCCILISATSEDEKKDKLPDSATMFTEIVKVYNCITVVDN